MVLVIWRFFFFLFKFICILLWKKDNLVGMFETHQDVGWSQGHPTSSTYCGVSTKST